MRQYDLPQHHASTNGDHPEPIPATRLDLTTDQPMTTPHQPDSMNQSPIPADLEVQATDPGIDPCDIAESAMPDLVFGDLAQADEDWVRYHTMTCDYCANVLHSLEDVCTSLDECAEKVDECATNVRPTTTMCLGIPEARYGFMETPVGDVLVASSDKGVVEIRYLQDYDAYASLRELEQRGYLVYERQGMIQPVIDQLQEYFAHDRTGFDLAVDLAGVSDFTRSVLGATSQIPYGMVRTYGDVASEIGKPKASRAVGNALGRNPIPVIIPCHRVILSSGAMGWYTGGPEIKRTLLGIEGVSYAGRPEPAQQSLGIEA